MCDRSNESQQQPVVDVFFVLSSAAFLAVVVSRDAAIGKPATAALSLSNTQVSILPGIFAGSTTSGHRSFHNPRVEGR